MQIKQKEFRKQEKGKKETSQNPGGFGENFRYRSHPRRPLILRQTVEA